MDENFLKAILLKPSTNEKRLIDKLKMFVSEGNEQEFYVHCLAGKSQLNSGFVFAHILAQKNPMLYFTKLLEL